MSFKNLFKFVFIVCLFFIAHFLWVKPIQATVTIEQQINILDQEFYSVSTTDVPTDNSLGLARWTSGSYTGATVYFEAVIKSGGSSTATATLYSSSGAAVSGAAVSSSSTSYIRVRSAAITLTDGTDYTVRIKNSNAASYAFIKAARIIIVQSDATKLTASETQIEVGNTEGNATGSYTTLTDKKLNYFDSTKFSPTPTTYFEAVMRAAKPKIEQQINIIDQVYYTKSTTDTPTDNSLGLVRWTAGSYTGATVYFEAVIFSAGSSTTTATLYNSAGSAITGSSVSSSTNGYLRVRSGAITLVDGTDYTVRIKASNASSFGSIRASRLIIIQSDSTKLTDTETQVEVGSAEGNATGSYALLTNKKLYNYDSTKFTPAPTAYFEADMRAPSPKIEQQINIIDQLSSTQSTTFVPTDNSLGLVRWTPGNFTGETVYFEVVMHGNGFLATAALYTSAGVEVTGSAISTTSSSFIRVRSNAITANLSDGLDYTVRIKHQGNTTANIKAARLIVVQSDSTKLTDTETAVEIGNNVTNITNTTYSDLTDFKIYQYNNSNFSPAPETAPGDVKFHATLKISDAADTLEAQLYNREGTAQVAEISTASTASLLSQVPLFSTRTWLSLRNPLSAFPLRFCSFALFYPSLRGSLTIDN